MSAETARAAVEILATRKILDPQRETQLRVLITAVRQGARPDEVIPAPAIDSRRVEVATAFITWLNEWREVARVGITRRDYRISLGLAQRRRNGNGAATDDAAAPARPTASA